jgi:hypothetical protein
MRGLALILSAALAGCAAVPDLDGRWLRREVPPGTGVARMEQALFQRGFRVDRAYGVTSGQLSDTSGVASRPIRGVRGFPVDETECWSQQDRLIEGGETRLVCFAHRDGVVTWSQALVDRRP